MVFILKTYYKSENSTESVQSQVHRKFNAYNRPTQETNVHTMYLSVSNILWPCVSLR